MIKYNRMKVAIAPRKAFVEQRFSSKSQQKTSVRGLGTRRSAFHSENIEIPSTQRQQVVDITSQVQDIVTREGIEQGRDC